MRALGWSGMDMAMAAGLCVFPLIGFTLLFMGLRNVWQAHSSKLWPVADGVITESSAETSRSGSGTMHNARIVASYNVQGQTLTTSTIHFGQTEGSTDSTEADLIMLRYPQGAKVRVSYNPELPSRAVLEPGFDSELLWLPGGGLAFALPGIMFLILHLGGGLTSSALKPALCLFALVFCLIGVAMLVPGLIRLWNGYSSERWPSAEGVLLKKAEAENTTVERDTKGNTSRTTTYSTGLVYEFAVNGKPHFSATRRFGQLAGASEEWAAEIASRYEQGGKVTVRYNPSDPDVAVLEPGINNEAFYLPGAGLAFLLFGLAVFVFAIPALTGE
jgi:hypothetical protein